MKSKHNKLFWQGAIFALFVFCSNIFAQTVLPQIPETDRIRLAEAFGLKEKLAEKVWKDWQKTPLGGSARHARTRISDRSSRAVEGFYGNRLRQTS